MKRELIKTIRIDKANLEHIAKTGEINGTLLIEIERVMTEYAQQQANEADTGHDKCHIQRVIKSVCPDCNGLTAIMGADGIFRPCHCQSQTVL